MGRTLRPPLDLLLAWQTDAFPHGVRRDWTLLILASVLSALVFIAVVVRLVARLRIQRNPGLDDVFIVPALLFTIAMNAVIAYTSRHGFDRHVWDLTPTMGVELRKFTFTISFLYIWGTGLTKISVLLFYRRLTASLPTPFLYVVYASLFYVFGYIIAFTFTLLFNCRPMYAYWMLVDFAWVDANASSFHCFDEGATLIAANAISITQDFLACIMPTLLLWRLQISSRQKIAAGALLGVSIFPCVAGILRFISIYRAAYTTYDIPWVMFNSWIWTLAEANTGLLCACVPALRILFKRTLHISLSRSETEDRRNGYEVPTIGTASVRAMREILGRGVGGGPKSGGGVDCEGVRDSTEELERRGTADAELKDAESTAASNDDEGCNISGRADSLASSARALDERRLVWWS